MKRKKPEYKNNLNYSDSMQIMHLQQWRRYAKDKGYTVSQINPSNTTLGAEVFDSNLKIVKVLKPV